MTQIIKEGGKTIVKTTRRGSRNRLHRVELYGQFRSSHPSIYYAYRST